MTLAIDINALSKTYRPRPGPPATAVANLSLAIPAGQIVALLGPPGAGKTTLIKLIGGLLRPTAGRIRLHDVDIARSPARAARHVGVMLGRRALQQRHSVWNNLLRCGQLKEWSGSMLTARAEHLLHELNLWEQRASPIHRLGLGVQHHVALACALIADPSIVLLDEPTGDLDDQDAHKLLASSRQLLRTQTVVLATSHPGVAYELCERVVVLRHGQVVTDQPVAELRGLLGQEHYKIRVKGHLSSDWSTWFDDLTVTNLDNGDAILMGPLADQAALHGILARLYALNLPLLGVNHVEPDLDEMCRYLLRVAPRPTEDTDSG
jgi:ABC-2 type transport system ATP-binding protein